MPKRTIQMNKLLNQSPPESFSFVVIENSSDIRTFFQPSDTHQTFFLHQLVNFFPSSMHKCLRNRDTILELELQRLIKKKSTQVKENHL